MTLSSSFITVSLFDSVKAILDLVKINNFFELKGLEKSSLIQEEIFQKQNRGIFGPLNLRSEIRKITLRSWIV